jgi:hypothetical protein
LTTLLPAAAAARRILATVASCAYVFIYHYYITCNMRTFATLRFTVAAATAAILAASMPICSRAFSNIPSTSTLKVKKSPPPSQQLFMGPPPIDTTTTTLSTDQYGENSRKYRRTVYTHEHWVKHRSSDRFINRIKNLTNSGIYKNVGREVFATTYVATFVWTWNLLVGGYEDFSGVMHDPLIHSNWAISVGLPLTIFTTLSPSLGLLLGE